MFTLTQIWILPDSSIQTMMVSNNLQVVQDLNTNKYHLTKFLHTNHMVNDPDNIINHNSFKQLYLSDDQTLYIQASNALPGHTLSSIMPRFDFIKSIITGLPLRDLSTHKLSQEDIWTIPHYSIKSLLEANGYQYSDDPLFNYYHTMFLLSDTVFLDDNAKILISNPRYKELYLTSTYDLIVEIQKHPDLPQANAMSTHFSLINTLLNIDPILTSDPLLKSSSLLKSTGVFIPDIYNCININQNQGYQNPDSYALQLNTNLDDDQIKLCTQYIKNNYESLDYDDIVEKRKASITCNNEATLSNLLDPYKLAPNQLVNYNDGKNNYCFAYSDIDYLLTSRKNPYTTLPLDNSFIDTLNNLANDPRTTIPINEMYDFYEEKFSATNNNSEDDIDQLLRIKIEDVEKIINPINTYSALRQFLQLDNTIPGTLHNFKMFLSTFNRNILTEKDIRSLKIKFLDILISIWNARAGSNPDQSRYQIAFGLDDFVDMRTRGYTYAQYDRFLMGLPAGSDRRPNFYPSFSYRTNY